MQYIPQVIFLVLTSLAIYFFSKKVKEIRRNILLGRDEDFSGDTSKRWKNVLLLAFGQKKMFKNPFVAVLHFFIYAGFLIINIEVLEIVLDGILGTHRLFFPYLGDIYSFLINSFEILAFIVLIGCLIFLARRNWIKLKRFSSSDLNGWARSDANNILITEVVLMSLFLLMNSADRALQIQGHPNYHDTGSFVLSGLLAPYLTDINATSLVLTERIAWWLHIVGIFAFLNYLPWSKHLHILLAFPNAYFARLEPSGKMHNMPAIQNEVLYAMQPELAPT